MRFGTTLDTFLTHDVQVGVVPMLLGEPGIGKSSSLDSLAEMLGTKCFTVAVNQLAAKEDLTGSRLMQRQNPDGTSTYVTQFFPMATVQDAIDYAKGHPDETPILFLDEINRTTPDVTSAILTLVTNRRLGEKLPDNIRIVCAGNDHGNVTSLDDASVSRFALYKIEPDVDRFMDIMGDKMDESVSTVLAAHPEFLLQIPQEEDDLVGEMGDVEAMRQICTPRTVDGLCRWLSSFDDAEIKRFLAEKSSLPGTKMSVLEEAVRGKVGDTPIVEPLMAELRQRVQRKPKAAQQRAAAVTDPVKPAAYDALASAPTVPAIDALVAQLSGEDKSACLLYALFEAADRPQLVESLARQTDQLVGLDLVSLYNLYKAGRIDDRNLATFASIDSKVADQVRPLGII